MAGVRNREQCYIVVGRGGSARRVLKLIARRNRDIVAAVPMNYETNFHTTRKNVYIHGTTCNGPPELRDYWNYERPPLEQLQDLELMKLVEVSPLNSQENAGRALLDVDFRTTSADGDIQTNVLVYVFLGPSDRVLEAKVRASNPPRITTGSIELAGFSFLVMVEAVPSIGGPSVCCKTSWFISAHGQLGVGPPFVVSML